MKPMGERIGNSNALSIEEYWFAAPVGDQSCEFLVREVQFSGVCSTDS